MSFTWISLQTEPLEIIEIRLSDSHKIVHEILACRLLTSKFAMRCQSFWVLLFAEIEMF